MRISKDPLEAFIKLKIGVEHCFQCGVIFEERGSHAISPTLRAKAGSYDIEFACMECANK